jgi:hypothetical protein
MPWFPDFVSAGELVRRQTRVAGRSNPVGEYLTALNNGDAGLLETVWPVKVVIYDPRAGEVRGHRQLRRFVRTNKSWLADRHARTRIVASTCSPGRAVVELLARLDGDGDGRDVMWPVAVVAESPDDRSVVFRTYCSQWPVDGRRHLRPAILKTGSAFPDDVVGRLHAALAAGDTEGVVATFAPDGYFREPIGPDATHRGTDGLRSFFAGFLSGGGIDLQPCAATDDGIRCAVEHNWVRWGGHDLPPQAGLSVYERGSDGLLTAVRAYDDVEQPAS